MSLGNDCRRGLEPGVLENEDTLVFAQLLTPLCFKQEEPTSPQRLLRAPDSVPAHRA